MNTLFHAIAANARCPIVGLFINLILAYIVWLLGKSLESLVPVWIVWIILAVAGIRPGAQRSSGAGDHS